MKTFGGVVCHDVDFWVRKKLVGGKGCDLLTFAVASQVLLLLSGVSFALPQHRRL